ncbi:MAG: hypothetical protein K2W78_16560 [Xanthobacteraceae bacterium]|nr:hypothetical protein [Xanthobacteraceae bacterium]
MTVEIIGFITLVVGIAGLFLQPSFIVYVFMASTLLGAAAAFILEAVGGTNISPSHLLLGFLSLTLLSQPDIRRNALTSIQSGGASFWLLVTLIYSLLSAYFLPRFFEGQTFVFAVRAQNSGSVLLAPSMSNITQSIYFIGNFVCFILLSAYANSAAGRRVLLNAALACAILNLGFAALDLITYWTGTTDLLSFIRNANYTLLSDTEVAGFKRIVGSFTEASSFGYCTLGYFAFTSQLWFNGVRPRLTFVVMMLSLISLVFSTSTTAYVGLGIYLIVVYGATAFRFATKSATPRMVLFLIAGPIVAAFAVLLIQFSDTYSAYIGGLLDTMVFNKLSTDSGVERSMWNQQALQSFVDTFGFGVGNGSVRASSFVVACLASLGFIGTIMYGMFLYYVMIGSPTPATAAPLDRALREAAKSTCLAWLIGTTVSGALLDLGIPFFAYAALASIIPSPYANVEKQRVEFLRERASAATI